MLQNIDYTIMARARARRIVWSFGGIFRSTEYPYS